MLDGETKRRETALQFITEVTEILLPVAKDIWGKGNSELSPNVVWINREEKGKREFTDYYFRYAENKNENEGFFFDPNDCGTWGTLIEDLRGSDFWSAIRAIIEWIPYVSELMDTRSASREELLSKINM
ncbi:MAG: hypothetical protein WC915_06765 [archaeon]